MTKPVTDKSFDQDVLKSDKPVLVDFWAEWCGPCKQIGPFVDQLSTELGDKIEVLKLNIDENPKTPHNYGVRGIPTLMVFKNGEVAATKVGSMQKTQLFQWVESVI